MALETDGVLNNNEAALVSPMTQQALNSIADSNLSGFTDARLKTMELCLSR